MFFSLLTSARPGGYRVLTELGDRQIGRRVSRGSRRRFGDEYLLAGPEPAITMTRILPIHPIEMKTTFRHCFLANFSVQPEALVRRLPSHLHPDIHRERAFVSVVIAEMSKMRPAFLPEVLGVTYNQVVYRAVVKCGAERGVTFLRSDADNAAMVAGGNALTFFRFNSADVSWERSPNRVRFALSPKGPASARIEADYELATASASLPPSSVFSDLGTAQSFLTELYAAFGARRSDGRVEIVRIVRTPWSSAVVRDQRGVYEAMTSGLLFTAEEAVLDSVFYVRELSYHWQRLALEAIAG